MSALAMACSGGLQQVYQTKDPKWAMLHYVAGVIVLLVIPNGGWHTHTTDHRAKRCWSEGRGVQLLHRDGNTVSDLTKLMNLSMFNSAGIGGFNPSRGWLKGHDNPGYGNLR
eukprot:179246-Ditylum_brightwellii.AAC.1